MTANKFKAGDQFPIIELPTLDGDNISLGIPQTGFDWKMVVVYRGKHCPLCTRYLNELEKLKEDFFKLGIDIVAVSADSETQVTAHMADLTVSYPVAYGLSIEQMQQLGLYISHPRSARETDHPFSEPGLYVINDKGQVQVLDISNGPFVRPELGVLLSGLSFIRNPENNYPIRGTYE
ncbi:AhpC/TSA family protein [Photobacterium sp. SDRW27]|uniref:peroxiredoxin-like family protein n=1 Tax=Photobacterium obscurum TaxID=2829490 RepID=UPI002244D5DF|nr:peroxiredoxin-like family protein [Photobacterium obscurum]MCW8327841.1 AhpC/TSA family protein [Photobacterium obscurum]